MIQPAAALQAMKGGGVPILARKRTLSRSGTTRRKSVSPTSLGRAPSTADLVMSQDDVDAEVAEEQERLNPGFVKRWQASVVRGEWDSEATYGMLWGPFYESYMSNRRAYSAVPVVKVALITVILLALFKEDPVKQTISVCALEAVDIILIVCLEPFCELKDYIIVFLHPMLANLNGGEGQGGAEGVSGTIILLLLLMVLLEMALLVYTIYEVVTALYRSCAEERRKRKLEKVRQAKAEAKALAQMLEDMQKGLEDMMDDDTEDHVVVVKS